MPTIAFTTREPGHFPRTAMTSKTQSGQITTRHAIRIAKPMGVFWQRGGFALLANQLKTGAPKVQTEAELVNLR